MVASTRSLTLRPDIGQHRCANGRRPSYSCLTESLPERRLLHR
jgi:hypothetical protein